MKKINDFEGFYVETLDFLMDLALNNTRTWFLENHDRYEKYLLDPFKSLVFSLGDFMKTINPHFETTPAVGKTISRINRDVRFLRNREPYRSNMWFSFKVPAPDWKDSPTFYFELFPDRYRYGMGFYEPSRRTMESFRNDLIDNPEAFLELVNPFIETGMFSLEGQRYKRIRREGLSPEIENWYQLKDFYLAKNREIDDELFDSALVDEIKEGFSSIVEFYRYLVKIRERRTD